LIQSLFAKLSVNLMKRKLTQTLRAAGIATGAVFNHGIKRNVGIAGSFACRKRFLIEKCVLAPGRPPRALEMSSTPRAAIAVLRRYQTRTVDLEPR